MSFPRVLVIDDQLARLPSHRAEKCYLWGLRDPDDSEASEPRGGWVAEGVFCSGQIVEGGRFTNAIDLTVEHVRRGWGEGQHWALVLLDVEFDESPPGREDKTFGFRILDALVDAFPDPDLAAGNCVVPVVVLTNVERAAGAGRANEAGARAYVEKQELSAARLRILLQEHGLIEDDDLLGREEAYRLRGRSLALLKTLRRTREVARVMGPGRQGNVLILGPQGSGKTTLARYLHAYSGRERGKFLPFYPSPTVAELEYSRLFGCWIRSHNQAHQSSAGMAELAHGGSLLVDEVHSLAQLSQQELLRYARLEAGKRYLSRLGVVPQRGPDVSSAKSSVVGELQADGSIAVDVLLAAATNEPIDDPAWRDAAGFSSALFTRLTEHVKRPLSCPGLAERREDIPALFEAAVLAATRDIGGRIAQASGLEVKPVAKDVLQSLTRREWPGNVSDLLAVAREAAIAARDFDEVLPRHVPPPAAPPAASTSTWPSATKGARSHIGIGEALRLMHEAVIAKDDPGLKGAWAGIDTAVACLRRRCLAAAAQSADQGAGRFSGTAAVRFLLGDDVGDLDTSAAKGEVARALGTTREKVSLDKDQLLAMGNCGHHGREDPRCG